MISELHPSSLLFATSITSIVFLVGITYFYRRGSKREVVASARKLQVSLEHAHADLVRVGERLSFLHEELGKVRDVR